ncbi:MAG: THUMP domain-containing class I SAM-dependent RNA methyltransferase [Fusobacteriaceae bacterium]
MTLIASSSMGIEGIVKDECKSLGFENIEAHNGRIEFDGDYSDIAKANIHLRCADRVYLKMGEFVATSFEELFQQINKIDWADIIPEDGAFPISWVSSIDSQLISKSDIQKIAKKSIVEKLKESYSGNIIFSEKGAMYAIKIQAQKDNFIVSIDTSGEPLHKRGYRYLHGEAPIKETLAAAMVYLANWRGGELPLIDPMCGTGTIPIEAAMIARKIAPGVSRKFASENWKIIPEKVWVDLRDDAMSKESYDKVVKIYASDIDEESIEIAKKNAKIAGVEDDIHFEVKNLVELEAPNEKGALISNPPYGERMFEVKESERLYTLLGDIYKMRFSKWSFYIITSHGNFEGCFGKKATKNRKLYNGGIKCYFYQYHGER